MRIKIKRLWFVAICFMVIFCFKPCMIYVNADENNAGQNSDIDITFSGFNDNFYTDINGNDFIYCDMAFGNEGYIGISVMGITADGGNISIKSSNENIATLETNSITPEYPVSSDHIELVKYDVKSAGESDITVTYGNVKKSIKLYGMPHYISVDKFGAASYDKVSLSWSKLSFASGYNIYRGSYSDKEACYKYSKIGTTDAKEETTYDYSAAWNKEYYYVISPYITLKDGKLLGVSGKKCTVPYNEDVNRAYTFNKPVFCIDNIKQSGGNITLSWDKNSDASSYAVYGSPNENGPFKKLADINDNKTTSYTYNKATLGDTYYFMVEYIFADKKTINTERVGLYVKTEKNIKASEKTIRISQQYKNGQYADWYNWASPDKTYYYKSNGKLHVVYLNNQKLYDYTITLSGKTKLYNRLDLGKKAAFGSFYKGTDDNLYVATIFNNPKESSKKVVIKLTQYNSKWKKLRSCDIKGGVTNQTKGIYLPLRAGNMRMDMSGNYLYMTTCREMFKSKDGLHHQSNIDFLINTKTMKLVKVGPVYSSHSFNQFVKIKSGNAYFLNHGDAYPRSVNLTAVSDYAGEGKTVFAEDVFAIKGKNGDNFTGLTLGGFEIGENNIISVGNSMPQFEKVDGVTGNKSTFKKNVFVTVTDKNTGKSKIVWLTKYNPKKSKIIVHEARLVKVSDTRFAAMFTETNGRTDTLNYILINENGKVIKKKTYSGIYFSASTQPIIYKGAIVWTDVKGNGKRVLCQIPVVTD